MSYYYTIQKQNSDKTEEMFFKIFESLDDLIKYINNHKDTLFNYGCDSGCITMRRIPKDN